MTATAPTRRRGRRRVPLSERRCETITAAVLLSVHADLHAAAAAQGTTSSEALRTALLAFLDLPEDAVGAQIRAWRHQGRYASDTERHETASVRALLTLDERAAVERLADDLGVTLSALLRAAVAQVLRDHTAESEAHPQAS